MWPTSYYVHVCVRTYGSHHVSIRIHISVIVSIDIGCYDLVGPAATTTYVNIVIDVTDSIGIDIVITITIVITVPVHVMVTIECIMACLIPIIIIIITVNVNGHG